MAVSIAAIAFRAVILLAIFEVVGARSIGGPFGHLRPAWIVLVAVAQLTTYPAYVLVYRSVVRLGQGGQPALSTIVRIVVAGFGPLAVSGGFGVDSAALNALGEEESAVQMRVGAIAMIEWAVLAPATCAVAIALLVTGADVAGALLWPWAGGVPVGVAAALYASRAGRVEKLSSPSRRRSAVLANLLGAIRSVTAMARRPRRCAGAWIGMTLYWVAEICALYAALRAVGLDLDVEVTVLAYATGSLASRRSLPLGGAGITEALLVYSLWQLGEPLGSALGAVLIYRIFNFVLVIIPSLVAYGGLEAPSGEPSS